MSVRSRLSLLTLVAALVSPAELAATEVRATTGLRFYLTVPNDSSVFTAVNHARAELRTLDTFDQGREWTMGGNLRQQNGALLILVDECGDEGTVESVGSQLACTASENNALCDTTYHSRADGQITYPLSLGNGPGDVAQAADSRDCPDDEQIADQGTGGGGDGGTESPPGDGTGLSPIVVDLDRGGFALTGAADGVDFDLDRDGATERVAWTAAASGDAFLALDRNGNGTIDDGGELFGDHTDQPASQRPNGFAALAVFDAASAGGDEDGWITPRDEIYEQLELWIDVDHDGASRSAELIPLAAAGIKALSLRATKSNRRDEHGNRLTYLGLVRLERGTTLAVDAFLAVAP